MFSAGNGGLFNGSCAVNEFVTSIYTIGISVVTGKNIKSRQDGPCSAIHAVTYARDGSLGIKYPHDRMVRICNQILELLQSVYLHCFIRYYS